jgi:hypothetical protein
LINAALVAPYPSAGVEFMATTARTFVLSFIQATAMPQPASDCRLH